MNTRRFLFALVLSVAVSATTAGKKITVGFAQVGAESAWRTAETDRKRKYYSLMKEGRAALAEAREQWRVVDDALKLLWSASHVRA